MRLTFFDFQHLQNAAFSEISSISTKSTTLPSVKRIVVLHLLDGLGLPFGQKAEIFLFFVSFV